jgi:hypothetical protein
MSGTTIDQNQEKAIAALLTCKTQAQAAAEAGVSEATLRRWRKVPEFRRAFGRAKEQIVSHAIAKLELAMDLAADTLVAGMRGDDANVAVRAAVAVLNQNFNVRDLRKLEKEVRRIMKIAEQNQADNQRGTHYEQPERDDETAAADESG